MKTEIRKYYGRNMSLLKTIIARRQLYYLVLPTLLYFAIFHYGPMYGVLIAFKNFKPHLGIWDSPWVGFVHFERLFRSPQFWRLIQNTLGLSFMSLALNFPVPIILALALNYVENKSYKKVVQTVTYAPHFISTVVVVSMLTVFLSPRLGIVNIFLEKLGGEPISFMLEPSWFKPLYVMSGIWQNAGWNTIIYLAALSAIDVSMHEAAIVDGASKLKRMWYIDLPSLMPTAVLLLILNLGRVMSIGFEKVYLMQNALNVSSSEIIATYIYKVGLKNAEYSYSAAVGFFNAVINLVMLVTVNRIAKKMGQASLW